jgi:lipoprotein NlpI
VTPAYGRPATATSRRTSLTGLTLLLTGGSSTPAPALAALGGDPKKLTRSGMAKFIRGDVVGSIEDFDKVLEVAPGQTPYLWQRGLSLYYAERYQEGADQFRRDVAVNPNDTEEAIWAFLCEVGR